MRTEEEMLAERLTKLQSARAEDLCIEDALALAETLTRADLEWHEAAAAARKEAENERDATKKAYDTAAELEKKRGALKRLETKTEALNAQRLRQETEKRQAEDARPEIEQLSAELVTIDRQLAEYPALEALERQRRDAEELTEKARADETKAAASLARIAGEKTALDRESGSLRDAPERRSRAEAALNALETAGEKLTALAERVKSRESAEADLQKQTASQRQAGEAESAALKERDALKEEQETLGNTALAVAESEGRLKACEDAGARLRERADLVAAWQKAAREYADAAKVYQTSRQKAETLREEANRLRRQYNDNIAGVLAAGLREAQPCPVCGSVHHPAPAVMAEAVDRVRVEAADRKATDAEGAATRDATACGARQNAAEDRRAQLALQMAGLADNEWAGAVSRELTENKALQTTLNDALNRAKAAETRSATIRETLLPAAERALTEAQNAKRERDNALQTAEQAVRMAAEEVTKAAAGLMPEGWTPAQLRDALEENRRERQTQRQLIDRAVADLKRQGEIAEQLHTLEEERQTQESLRAGNQTRAAEQTQRLEGLRTQIDEKKRGLLYASRAEADAAVTQKTNRREALQNAIRETGERLLETVNRLSELGGQATILREQLAGAPVCELEQL